MMAGEARKAWKAVLHQLAVDVHVLDPLVDVPGGLAHLVEGSRFHAIFVARPAGNGVHPDHRHEAVLEYPAIASAQTNIAWRSEEHTSELQSLMRISYAVFCLKKKKPNTYTKNT